MKHDINTVHRPANIVCFDNDKKVYQVLYAKNDIKANGKTILQGEVNIENQIFTNDKVTIHGDGHYEIVSGKNFDAIAEGMGLASTSSGAPSTCEAIIDQEYYQARCIEIINNKIITDGKTVGVFYPANLQNLLDAVVKGKRDVVANIIKANPRLLLMKGDAVTYSGKKINNKTALQMALLESDVSYRCNDLDKFPGLAEELILAMESIQNGVAHWQQQFKEIFPDGVDAKFTVLMYRAQQTSEMCEFLMKRIMASDPEACTTALEDQKGALATDIQGFRKACLGFLSAEDAFNPYHLCYACREFSKLFFDSERAEQQRNLAWIQIVGFFMRHCSAFMAQVLATDVIKLLCISEMIQVGRSLSITEDDETIEFFPLDKTQGKRLGYDFAFFNPSHVTDVDDIFSFCSSLNTFFKNNIFPAYINLQHKVDNGEALVSHLDREDKEISQSGPVNQP